MRDRDLWPLLRRSDIDVKTGTSGALSVSWGCKSAVLAPGLVNYWVSISCQAHRVTSGRSGKGRALDVTVRLLVHEGRDMIRKHSRLVFGWSRRNCGKWITSQYSDSQRLLALPCWKMRPDFLVLFSFDFCRGRSSTQIPAIKEIK